MNEAPLLPDPEQEAGQPGAQLPDELPGVPWKSRLTARLLACVFLPVAGVLVALLFVQQSSGRSGALHEAQERLAHTLEVADELIAARTERFGGMLSALITQDSALELVELWDAGELERAALTSARIERSCEQLLQLEKGLQGIELYSAEGKLFLSVAGGAAPPAAFDVKSEPWFGTAERQGSAVSSDREGSLRFVLRHADSESQRVLYGSIVVDLAHVVEPVVATATRDLEGARLSLETDTETLYLTDTLTTAHSEVLSAAVPTTFCRGSLRIQQARDQAVASRASSGAAALILAAILLATLWVALQHTVLVPLSGTARVARAFRDVTELPEEPDGNPTAPLLKPAFKAIAAGRRAVARIRKVDPAIDELQPPPLHELAQVDRALRDAIAVARASEHGRRELNQTFDRRVVEYTSTLARGKQEAETANRERSEFLTSLASALRTPLGAAIRGTEELLEGELTGEQRELAQATHGSANDVLGALDEVRDFTALETGRAELQAIEFDLHNAVEDAADLLAKETTPGKGELVAEILPGVPRQVVGDPVRLCQVVTALAQHLADAGEDGDTLVRVSPSHAAATQLLFEVRNTRALVTPPPQDPAFDPFSASRPISRRASGLALAICRQLVGRMQGELSWRSAPNEGTTFWFTVSLNSVAGQPPQVTGLEQRRLLVVDDNQASRRALAAKLAHWGAEAAQATGTREAISMVQEATAQGRPFAAAVVDREMPELDGLDFARWIKDDVDHLEMPLLLLEHGESDLGTDASLFAARIGKPVRAERLASALVRALEEADPGPDEHAPAAAPAAPKSLSLDAGTNAPAGAPALRGPLALTTAGPTRGSIPVPARPTPPSTPEPEPAAARDDAPPLATLSEQAAADAAGTVAPTEDGSTSEWCPEDPTRILLAQNPSADADNMARVLERLGYGVVRIEDGEEVLELVGDEPFHALLIDRDLEGMDGPRVARRVRNRPDLKASMPIIGLTAGSANEERDGCVQAGMDDCLAKPSSVQDLGSTLRRWVSVCSHLSPGEQETIARLHAERSGDDA